MILCSLSGIWSANWSDDNRDDNDMLSYFTVIARGSSMSIVVCYTLMTDPVQLAKWQFEPLEISQKVFHGSNFVWILDWISASSVWTILTLGRSLEVTCCKINTALHHNWSCAFISNLFSYSSFCCTANAINNAFTMPGCKIFPGK